MTRNRAFTLVELLVVITIIGILMSLLLPSLAVMRENGNRLKCSNNLKQIALAFQSHVATNGYYPTGGWGFGWAGDPDRGFGVRQPGGWIYNILPFLDAVPLHSMGKGLEPSMKKMQFGLRAGMPMAIMNCPSRRRPTTWPFHQAGSEGESDSPAAINYDPAVEGTDNRVARSDYAANGGSVYVDASWVNLPSGAGLKWTAAGPPIAAISPKTVETDDTLSARSSYLEKLAYIPPKQTTSSLAKQKGFAVMGRGPNGIIFPLSLIGPAHIRDGAGYTYMVSEKHLNPDDRTTGADEGDQYSMYGGDYREITRWTEDPPMKDTNAPLPTVMKWGTNKPADITKGFGSAHPAGFNAAFCDGTVRLIGYTIEMKIHRALSTRDGSERIDPITQNVKDIELPIKPDDIP